MPFFRYIGTEVREHFNLGTIVPGRVVEAAEIDDTHAAAFEPVSDREGKAALATQAAEDAATVEVEPPAADVTSEPAAEPAAEPHEDAAQSAQE